MSFFEEILVGFFQEVLLGSFQWIGIGIKWLFYLGRKPIGEIKNESWNTRIGFFVFILIICMVIFLS